MAETDLPYPFEWHPRTGDDEDWRSGLFSEKSSIKECVISNPGDVVMPKTFTLDLAQRIYNFKVRPDDVWIATYPKCGTTWSQEMIWQIINDCKLELGHKIPLMVRSPFLEFEGIVSPNDVESVANAPEAFRMLFKESVNFASSLPSPRVIKSHLPLDMLPPDVLSKSKVIYVARNPKDCCVSYYHHAQLLGYGYGGSFADFAKMFKDGTFEYGSYFHHIKTALKYRDDPNFMMIWYEDMKKDLASVIRKVANFLGKEMTDENLEKLVAHLHIDNFRKISHETFAGNEKVQSEMVKFFRKGEVGDWKNYFNNDDEDSRNWIKWLENNVDDLGIDFKFE